MKLHFLLSILFSQFVFTQFSDAPKIHSHNDYQQDKPFWEAYKNGASSIEVDIVMTGDTLFVSHHANEIIPGKTIEKLYLEPIKELNLVQSDSPRKLQLLIDIKSDAKPTLKKLMEVLIAYEVLAQNENISFVISGNRPPVAEYIDYPNYILFDYQSLSNISDTAIWEKIALISLPFYKYSDWDGKTALSNLEAKKISGVIAKAHAYGKPFRFWATPDTELAWKTFSISGLDFINTDNPSGCSKYLDSIKKEHP